MKWADWFGGSDLCNDQGRPVATAGTAGHWHVQTEPSRAGIRGRADPPTLEAAKAEAEAYLWAQTAARLVGR